MRAPARPPAYLFNPLNMKCGLYLFKLCFFLRTTNVNTSEIVYSKCINTRRHAFSLSLSSLPFHRESETDERIIQSGNLKYYKNGAWIKWTCCMCVCACFQFFKKVSKWKWKYAVQIWIPMIRETKTNMNHKKVLKCALRVYVVLSGSNWFVCHIFTSYYWLVLYRIYGWFVTISILYEIYIFLTTKKADRKWMKEQASENEYKNEVVENCVNEQTRKCFIFFHRPKKQKVKISTKVNKKYQQMTNILFNSHRIHSDTNVLSHLTSRISVVRHIRRF